MRSRHAPGKRIPRQLAVGVMVVLFATTGAVELPRRNGLHSVEWHAGRGARPLVIVLHGYGGSMSNFVLPLQNSCARFVGLQGPLEVSTGGFAWFPHKFREISPEGEPELEQLADRVAVAARNLQADGSAEGLPVLVGYSQGGILSLMVGARYPGKFSAVLAISAALPPGFVPPRAPRPLPIHIFYGTHDRSVDQSSVDASVRLLRGQGFRVALHKVSRASHRLESGSQAVAGVLSRLLHASSARELSTRPTPAKPLCLP